MEKLLTLNYYLNTRPDPDFQHTKLTIIIIVLLFLLGFSIRIYRKKYAKDPVLKKLLKKYPSRFMGFGAVLLFLWLMREAGIPFVSMRLWWVILFIYVVYWAIKVGLNFRKDYYYRSKQADRNAVRKKYLPKKKKR